MEATDIDVEVTAVHIANQDKYSVMSSDQLETLVGKGSFGLLVDGSAFPVEGTINDGLIDVPIPIGSKEAKLTLINDKGETVEEVTLLLAHKDPPDTIPGALSRMILLGIEPSDTTPGAIEECIWFFQEMCDLPEDGTLNEATQSNLNQIGGKWLPPRPQARRAPVPSLR